MNREIYKISVAGKSVGRVSSEIAILLRGKNKPEFQRHIDCGGIVEISGLEEMTFTGKKLDQKKYYSYSGYPGGLKERKMGDVFQTNPFEVLRHAVREMLPPVKFRTEMLKRLRVSK